MKQDINVAYSYSDNYDLNSVRKAVDQLFKNQGFDLGNPLGHLIKPGMTVFIKPNWVASKWRTSCPHRDDLFCIITHPNVLEVIADYVDIALDGRGKILIGDNSSIDADFQELMNFLNIQHLKTKYRVSCEVLDLRPLVCTDLKNYGKQDKMVQTSGDPLGTTIVNLGRQSMLYDVNSKLFHGVFNERQDTIKAHTGETQLYGFSKSIYDADVYISIPKMKTHHKVGVTLNLKGLVGTITEKNHLVHWRVGFPAIGGDEYSDFFSWLKGSFTTVKERGAWNGNDTIWRMVVDLYHALGIKNRICFSIVDGIVGGEGKGPFCAHKKNSNILVGGEDLLAVDLVCTRLMGFSPDRIPYLNYFLQNDIKMNEIMVHTAKNIKIMADQITGDQLNYFPSEHWKNLRDDGCWL